MKYFIIILAVLVFIFATAWSFNHIDPWISILFVVVSVLTTVYFNQRKLKKNEKF